jgi:hypothetical protein
MATQAQGASSYYIWEVPGATVSVHLHFDVVDRLSGDVMRGFSAVPKRGAEVGGILLGAIEYGERTIVRIDDFKPVESQHRTGPSYLLSDEDRAKFLSACEQWQPGDSQPRYAVGFYRSNTRDGLLLAPEDVELLDDFFPSPAHVALLIKPYGTKAAAAGFFFRIDGLFPVATLLEFPFRRSELCGVEDVARALTTRHKPDRENYPSVQGPRIPPASSASRGGLRIAVWIPLSFVFLLSGIALGLMIALAHISASARDSKQFLLGLSVSRSDDNLSVRWDREAPAIRAAARGALEIEDGTYIKSVELDTAQLKNGSIIYRNSSGDVRFRLVVYPKDRVSVAETIEWRH